MTTTKHATQSDLVWHQLLFDLGKAGPYTIFTLPAWASTLVERGLAPCTRHEVSSCPSAIGTGGQTAEQ